MQKLGKKFPDLLQKCAWILMTEFIGHKESSDSTAKNNHSCTLFSKARVCQSHALPRQVWSQSPLMRAVGVLEHHLPELSL